MKTYIVDMAVVVIVLWELFMGMRRGLSGELFRLIGTCIVFAVGLTFYEGFGKTIAAHSRLAENQDMAMALAFLLIILAAALCVFFLRLILGLLVKVKFNDSFDRPAGGAAGFLRGCLLAALLLFAAGLWPNNDLQPLITADSYVGRMVFKLAPRVNEKIHSVQISITAGEKSQPAPGKEPEAKTRTIKKPRPGRALERSKPDTEPNPEAEP